MPKKKRWEASTIVDGVGEVKLLSWKYFLDFMYIEMLNYETYIWRGQRCDNWPLESTLDRLVKKANVPNTKIKSFRNAHLEKFKFAVRGRRGPNPPSIENENDWWALGQHHGLATPLLDWTTSPFVGAYFAFIGANEKQTSHRVVYGLHVPSIKIKAEILFNEEELAKIREKQEVDSGRKKLSLKNRILLEAPTRHQVEFVRPYSDENQRLVNQGGLFTRAPDGIDLESWIKSNFQGDTGYELIKILIPNTGRKECLKTLNRMNINHSTLFPDLYGASTFCNLFGEIEKY